MIDEVKDLNSLKLEMYKLEVETRLKEEKLSNDLRSLVSLRTLREEGLKEAGKMMKSAGDEDGKLNRLIKKAGAFAIGYLVKKFVK